MRNGWQIAALFALLTNAVFTDSSLSEETMESKSTAAGDRIKSIETGDLVTLDDRGQSLGSAKSQFVLMEFSTYDCPYCVTFDREVFPTIKSHFVDTGRLRFVFRHLPLDIFPNSFKMAQAARCADAQSAFWNASSYLYSKQPFRKWRDETQATKEIAQATSINLQKFRECLASKRFDDDIRRDMADAAALNITGTPTFVLGRVENGKLAGMLIVGARPKETFEEGIKVYLNENKLVIQ